MASSAPVRFILEEGGHAYAVETDFAGLNTVARLFVDGQQADEQKGMEKAIHLNGGGLAVEVGLNWLGQVTEILAVPRGTDPKKAAEEGIAFAPPAGSRAARMEEMRRKHPELHAARHVAFAILQVLAGILGFGALFWGLVEGILPRINLPLPDLPDIPWPTIDLPDVPWPTIPWPDVAIPDLSFLAPLKELWSSVNWLVPIVIAIVVALNELGKRRKREARGGKGGRGIGGK